MGTSNRTKHIEVLEDMLVGLDKGYHVAPSEERVEALRFAISSIKVDLKYDLLYEEFKEGRLKK